MTEQTIDELFAKAVDLHHKNHFIDAEQAYVEVLRMQPAHYQALHSLAMLYETTGHIDRAAELFDEATRINPNAVESQYSLALMLFKLKQYNKAADVVSRAAALDPSHRPTLNLRALIAYERKCFTEALTYADALLAIDPNNSNALNVSALILKDLGRYPEAIVLFDKALALAPNDSMLLYNKSWALFSAERYADALLNLNNLLAYIEPNYVMALTSKANTLVRFGLKPEVIECYKKVLAIAPQHYSARSELLYNLMCVCDWDELETHTKALTQVPAEFTLEDKDIVVPITGHILPHLSRADQAALSKRYGLQLSAQVQPLADRHPPAFSKTPKSVLRIGYLSSDFREHPLAQLITETLELHDRAHFSVYAYSDCVDEDSASRKRIKNAVDHFIDIRHMEPEQILQKIRGDEIDILVDLTGFAWVSPTQLLALRLAPVQVSYLGYLGTMGVDYVDAIIADEFVIPPAQQHEYSEKVYYLPCYQANDRQCKVAEKPTRAACGLPEDAFVFCCFNATYKITPDIFDVWCRLLKQVPDSVLWLVASNKWAVDNLRKHAEAAGVDPSRLIFADSIVLDQHLARLQCADLFLDTSPYNAGTTASNALWVGLPIVTYSGQTFPSRMAGSLLTALGVPELITYSLEDYYQAAFSLATNREKLRTVTEKVRANRATSILFDTPFFVRHLEDAYRRMWHDYIGSP